MADGPTPAEKAAAHRADALKSGGDFMKLMTSLATGALVFSVGLLPNLDAYPAVVHFLLLACWGLFLAAVGLGLLAQASIPPMIAADSCDIEDPYLVWPVRLQQIVFAAALLVLAAALTTMLFGRAPEMAVRTAAEAVERARAAVPPARAITGLEQVSAVASPLAAAKQATWRVQFDVSGPGAATGKLDVLIDPRNGHALVVP